MSCPICGAKGFELFSRFECERPGCRNYATQSPPQNPMITSDCSPPRSISETPSCRLLTREEFEAAERMFSGVSLPIGPDGSCIVTDARGRQDRVGWRGAHPDFEALDNIAAHLCAQGFTSPVTVPVSHTTYRNLIDERTVGLNRKVNGNRDMAACAHLVGDGAIIWMGAVELLITPPPRRPCPKGPTAPMAEGIA